MLVQLYELVPVDIHLANVRPWPLTGSIRAIILTSGLFKWFYQYNADLFILAIITATLTIIQWRRDITREITKAVTSGLQWSIISIITSEVLFFFSFFWTFFHRNLSPYEKVGSCWPPTGIQTLIPSKSLL